MKYQAVIITGAGFIIGVAEALVYYNLGQSSGRGFTYKIPPRKELLTTASIVLVTSVLTALLTRGIERVTGLETTMNQTFATKHGKAGMVVPDDLLKSTFSEEKEEQIIQS